MDAARPMTPERWRQITDAFHAALARDTPARGALLDEICAGDACLRAEVEALLAAHRDAGHFGEARDAIVALAGPRFQPGEALGPYRVEALLGAGGMGEVYRARDPRLARGVAIKVLRLQAAGDAALKQRFDREAKVLATLSHPHICPVFDVGQQDGIDYLVMEHLEGETLAGRLARGGLPLGQALRHAVEIADALDKAHRHGIVHRDLKPGNVMLTKAGATLLDFGIAKLRGASPLPASGSPDATGPLTHHGVVLGTLHYMAPEQVKGAEADARSDIFAFGALVYEMVTGTKAFDGRTRTEVLAAILEGEPASLSTLQPASPPALDRLLRSCLAKDPDQRWQSAGDIGRYLNGLLGEPATPGGGVATLPRAKAWSARRLGTLLAGVGVGGLVVAAGVWLLAPAPVTRPRPVVRFEQALPAGLDLRNVDRSVLAVTPDGSQFVYNTTGGLYVRSLDEVEPRLIVGPEEDASNPFFSPDGRWIGYHAGGELKKVSAAGGSATSLAPAEKPFGVEWSQDGWILVGQREGVFRVRDTGGAPEWLVKTHADEQVHGPRLLPGGEWLLMTVAPADSPSRWDVGRIVAQSLHTGERRLLWTGGSDARYVPTGHLVFAVKDDLAAIAFDPRDPRISGQPVRVVSQIQRPPYQAVHAGYASYAVSDEGTLVFIGSFNPTATRVLGLCDWKGTVERLDVPPAPYVHAQVSPDGRHVAVQTLDENRKADVWIYELTGNRRMRQLTTGGNSWRPYWTPDSRRVTFASDREGIEGIYWQTIDTAVTERLVASDTLGERDNGPWLRPEGWSPVGPTLAYRVRSPTDSSLWTIVPGSGRPPTLLTDLPGSAQYEAAFSPDGRWFAYTSNETGSDEIYVQPFPPTGVKHRATQHGGSWAMWSPDGRLVYRRSFDIAATRSTGMSLFALDVTMDRGVWFGTERALPLQGFIAIRDFRNYGLTPDGKKFVVLLPAGKPSPGPRITIVQNWFEDLKARVPPRPAVRR